MIDTNAILSIGFALVSNFTSVVTVPQSALLTDTNCLEKYVVGSLHSPVDLSLFDKKGNRFWIWSGVVQAYESADSYFLDQSLTNIAKYVGKPTLSSNQVADLALSTIERLSRNGNPIKGVVPHVELPTPTPRGGQIPFYRFTWPPRDKAQSPTSHAAQIEIDARNGHVVYLVLWDPCFFDYQFTQLMSNKVYTPDPTARIEKPPLNRNLFPSPTTKQTIDAISNWLQFCVTLGFDPGKTPTVTDVDWKQTYLYTNRLISIREPVCQVRFHDGTCFESIRGLVIGHYSSDACFSGIWDDRTAQDWQHFRGRVSKKWEDLAKQLEGKLTEKLTISKTVFQSLRPLPVYLNPKLDSDDIVRCVVRWHKVGEDTALSELESPGVLTAEFDLQTGDVKWISMNDLILLKYKGIAR